MPFHGSSSHANASSIVSCMVYTNFKPRHIYCKSRPKNVRWMLMLGLRYSHSPCITYSNGLPCMMSNNILWHPFKICFRLPHAMVDERNAAISMSWMSVNIRGNFTGSLSMNAGVLNFSTRASNWAFNSLFIVAIVYPTAQCIYGAVGLCLYFNDCYLRGNLSDCLQLFINNLVPQFFKGCLRSRR